MDEKSPPFTTLNCTVANDEVYDGPLVGLPCVFFTTTLYKNNLPTISPYPSGGVPGKSYWRLKVPLRNFENYDMWYCEDIVEPQKRLILTTGNDSFDFETIPRIQRLDKENNPFLCVRNGRWRTNDWTDPNHRYFVSFVVLNDVDLTFCESNPCNDCKLHCMWDTVPRSSAGPGHPLGRQELFVHFKRQWFAYQTSGINEKFF